MSLSVRLMTPDDIPLGMRLKEHAGWNQTPADWNRFLNLEPRGCFVAEWNGRSVGTTTTCTFGAVGWIAMVLVDESFRHRGIATGLVERALAYLEEQSVNTVCLDATRFGQPVYERIGFVAQRQLARMRGVAPSMKEIPQVARVGAKDLPWLADADRRATGTDRRRLLERLLGEQPAGAGMIRAAGPDHGYVMLRPGAVAAMLGPAVAGSAAAGRLLLDWALGHCAGRPVLIDIPLENGPAIGWARERGLAEQRQFARMYRGLPVAENTELLWASSGPEKG